MGNSSPLDNSLRIANTGMIHLLMDEYGFRLEDATFLSSILFRVKVNQAFCPPSSVSVMFPKEYLPDKVKT
jgi:acetamidase/formamidase